MPHDPATADAPIAERETDVLLAAYQEQCEQSRHYENQHLTVVGFVMGVATTIVTLATFDENLTWRDRWLGGAIVGVGCFGFFASIAYYSRTTRHALRAEELRFRLDQRMGKPTLTEMRKTADDRTGSKLNYFKGLQRIRLHHVWLALDLVVVVVGVIVIAMSLRADGASTGR
jgi:hypothetical protein